MQRNLFNFRFMKKILKLIGSLAIGAMIGLLLAFLLILIIDGSEGIGEVMNKDINASKIAISMACTFASLIITRGPVQPMPDSA